MPLLSLSFSKFLSYCEIDFSLKFLHLFPTVVEKLVFKDKWWTLESVGCSRSDELGMRKPAQCKPEQTTSSDFSLKFLHLFPTVVEKLVFKDEWWTFESVGCSRSDELGMRKPAQSKPEQTTSSEFSLKFLHFFPTVVEKLSGKTYLEPLSLWVAVHAFLCKEPFYKKLISKMLRNFW